MKNCYCAYKNEVKARVKFGGNWFDETFETKAVESDVFWFVTAAYFLYQLLLLLPSLEHKRFIAVGLIANDMLRAAFSE